MRTLRPDAVPGFGARLAAVARAARDLVMNNGRNDGPPDLDELWRDFNRKLSGLFGGGKGGGGNPSPRGGGDDPGFQPDMKSAGIGLSLVVGLVALVWAGSGLFIVQEGHQAVVTTFGKYSSTASAGMQYRLPYPFQAHETVPVTQLRSAEIGGGTTVGQASGLRGSSMLTQDENIVDIRFIVQYVLKDPREFLFENRDTEQAVIQASESAVREIVGRSKVDSVLYERRDAIANDLVNSIQTQLNRLNAGVTIKNVNLQTVQVPEQVQAAFDDVVKAGADRDRFKNEGKAYASQVIPTAEGTSARLHSEAEGYRSRIIANAEGDADRFNAVYGEYQKAPAVTRDRLYVDAMRDIYASVTKVLVDSRQGSNLLYLPLDKLIQQGGTQVPTATIQAPSTPVDNASSAERPRDLSRSRDREAGR